MATSNNDMLQEKIIEFCTEGNLEELMQLLESTPGVDLNFRFKGDPKEDFRFKGVTPLIQSITYLLRNERGKNAKERLECIRLLIKKSADPNYEDDRWKTAPLLMVAKEGGERAIEVMEMLISAKANLNIRDGAPLRRSSGIRTSMLLQAGASINSSIFSSKVTSEDYIFFSSPAFRSLSESDLTEYFKVLNEDMAGMDRARRKRCMQNFLEKAIEFNNTRLIDHILKTDPKYLDLNEMHVIIGGFRSENSLGLPMFTIAKQMRNPEVIKKLMDMGAIDYENYEGSDPIKCTKRDFLKCGLDAINAAHIQGFKKISIPELDETNSKVISTESSDSEQSIPFLKDLLDVYLTKSELDKEAHEELSTIRDAFQREINRFGHPMFERAAEVLQNHEKGNLEILSSGWSGHAIYVALYKGHLILCNRGNKASNFNFIPANTLVYKLKEDAPLKENLPIILDRNFYTPNDVMGAIGRLVDLRTPLASFPSKDQKHGTCSLVNAKSIMEPVQYVLNLERRQVKTPTATETNETLSKQYSRKQYKLMTSSLRRLDIERRIKLLSENLGSSGNKRIVETQYRILKKIITSHHGGKKMTESWSDYLRKTKPKQECERVMLILNSLPHEIQSRMIKELSEPESEAEQSILKNIFLNAVALKQNALVLLLLEHVVDKEFLDKLFKEEDAQKEEFLIHPLLDILLKEQAENKQKAKMIVQLLTPYVESLGLKRTETSETTAVVSSTMTLSFDHKRRRDSSSSTSTTPIPKADEEGERPRFK